MLDNYSFFVILALFSLSFLGFDGFLIGTSGTSDGDGCNLDAIGEVINDLIMWKDVSKSSLWFGFGSLCFVSSCFTRGINFRYSLF